MKNFTVLFILLFALFGTTTYMNAQTFTEQTGLPFSALGGYSVAWGDYDNDGDLDLLMGADKMTSGGSYISDSVRLYRNNGDGTFTVQKSIVFPASTGSVTWGDCNNDGYLDILYAGINTYSAYVKLYMNNKDNTFTENTSIAINDFETSILEWGDYDNDGHLDFLIAGGGSSGNSFRIYHNNGDNTFTEKVNLPQIVNYSSASWVDYDNDGYLDFLLTNGDAYLDSKAGFYHNNGDGTFTRQIGFPLKTYANNTQVAWGDYDNDGYLDLLLNGETGVSGVNKVFHNNGDGTFSEQTSIALIGLYRGSIAWGDYDNDGYLDILVTGYTTSSYRYTKIYHNNGNGSFTEFTGTTFPGTERDATWCDLDNDGDLDLFFTVYFSSNCFSKLFKNNIISAAPKTANIAPAAPTNLHILSNQNGNVTFAWDKATDAETPQNGLSYNLYVYENGKSNYQLSPQAFVQTSSQNGQRLIAKMGAILYNAAGYTLKNLSSGNYKWSVQAIDGGFKGGPFAAEVSLNVLNLSKIGVNVAANLLTNTSADMEYSVNSTDGSTGDWVMCTSQFTTLNYGTGGFDVWVREHASPSNKRLVAFIAAQVTPSFTIDFINEKTTQVIPDSVEYAVNADMSGAIAGSGVVLKLTPGQNLYFRNKVTVFHVVSKVQKLTVPERSIPNYSIDFASETTNEVILPTDKVSTTITMGGSDLNPGGKMVLTPGRNLYFQSKVSATSFVSNVQTLVVPLRPAIPNYTIDFANEITTENVAITDEYSLSNNMVPSIVGAGEKIKLTPLQNLFFRVKATSTNFASLIQFLSVPNRSSFVPTLPIVNDVANTFDWTLENTVASYFEYSTDNGITWVVCTEKPINIGNVNLAAGFVQVRVKPIANSLFAGLPLKSDAAFTINTGVSTLSSLGIEVFPNPVKNTLFVHNVPAACEATLWSSDGKLIKTVHLELKNSEIDVNVLRGGVYILILQNSKFMAETRFVKQ